ncbi:hypothetical protein L1987_50416 [Smallanthus sonchifolius]|uniref:Uncharacterized protein n=1 Tax=Smallanthus sonchifolius TaxID=185202 RepID=A0ACB9ELW0_9ASTR|nr:hypothetical protein L1987_50416 [Smallanthus sonchifolius]
MTYNVARTRSQKKLSTASRGIRSLSLAIVVPVGLTLTTIFWFGEGYPYKNLTRPFWITPLWGLHLTSLSTAFLMGLSAWLVWAERGFHRTPVAIVMYLAQLGLGLAWNHIFFKTGPTQTGLALSFGQLIKTYYRHMPRVNIRISGGNLGSRFKPLILLEFSATDPGPCFKGYIIPLVTSTLQSLSSFSSNSL